MVCECREGTRLPKTVTNTKGKSAKKYAAGQSTLANSRCGSPRGVVDGVVDEVKTEYSEDDLPLDPDLAIIPLSWKDRCPKSEERRGGCPHS